MQSVLPTDSTAAQRFKLSIVITLALAALNGPALAQLSPQDERSWAAIQAAIEVFNGPRVTTNDVVRLLEIKGQFTDSKVLIQYIGDRAFKEPQLTFSMTARDIESLKRAGATPDLIAAMKSPASVARAPQTANMGAAPQPALGAKAAAAPAAVEGGGASAGAANVEIIIDASGSMKAKMGSRTKMEIAKEVLAKLVTDLPADAKIALRAYGHRDKDDCNDIELLSGFGSETRGAVRAKVGTLKPLGKTPIARSLELAGKDFTKGARNMVILISDGEETCNADPCEVARSLKQSGVDVRTSVVGFDVSGKQRRQLECIADVGGGKYYDAADASALAAAATQVQAEVAAAPPPSSPPAATANPTDNNILAQANGGQVLVAPGDGWTQTNDGKEDGIRGGTGVSIGAEAVYAFKDEEPATFDKFATLVPSTDTSNLKEFELLVADDSPTGTFRSIGTFTVQNAKMLKSPYQEFKFEPVTAKYLKVKLVSNYGAYQESVSIYEFKVFGQTNAKSAGAASSPIEKKAESPNILAQSAGGQVLAASGEGWTKTNDGKEDAIGGGTGIQVGVEAVYAFKDEQPATFDKFATLVPNTDTQNLKEFELLVADDSPTGAFRSIGTFTVQNAKMLKSPYQEFKFEPVTAKYLKIKLVSNYGAYQQALKIYEFKLFGQPNARPSADSSTQATAAKPEVTSTKAAGETKSEGTNILAQSDGGQVLIAPSDGWQKVNDGKEDPVGVEYGQEVVYAFRDEKPATFDRFATFVAQASNENLKEFELFVGDESPTGTFRSIGTFTVQNVRMIKSPYQEFKFEPVMAKYLKVKLISNYGAYQNSVKVAEFKLFGSVAK